MKKIKAAIAAIADFLFGSSALFKVCFKVYCWALRRVRRKAFSILYCRILLKVIETNADLELKILHDHVICLIERLIKGESVEGGYDEETVRFGESVHAELSDSDEIRCALVDYLKIILFIFSTFKTDPAGKEIEALNTRLNQLGVSERIDNHEIYFNMYKGLSAQGKRLLKQTRKEHKHRISNAIWEKIGGWNFSLASLAYIVAIISSAYFVGSFIYVHILLNQFGLDAANFLAMSDYVVAASSIAYKLTLPFLLAAFIIFQSFYSDAKRQVIEPQYKSVTRKSTVLTVLTVTIAMLIVAYNIPAIKFLFLGDGDTDDLVRAAYIDGFLILAFLLGRIPFKRIFKNGILVKILILAFWIFIGEFVFQAFKTAENIKSEQDSKWQYLIEGETLTSDKYSLILNASRYSIFYHRDEGTTRIVPAGKIDEIIYVPKD